MDRQDLMHATREELIAYLESWGFSCHDDSEPTEDLRTAALLNHDTEGA